MTTALSTTTADAYGLIMQAVKDKDCDPAKLRELLAVRREWEADEARKLFALAISEFQRECHIIAKGDVADGKAYAKLDRIWREVRPLMEKCGLSVTWTATTIEGEICHLRGTLRHIRGHCEPLEYMLPIPKAITRKSDGQPIQNAAQVMGSATTYAKRYALCAALGIQTGEDDDGRGGNVQPATAQAVGELREAIRALGRDEAKACAMLGVERLEDASAEGIKIAMRTLPRVAK